MIPFVLAQALQTPAPIATPSPVRETESSAIGSDVDAAIARARAAHLALGVVVVDLATGARVERNASQSLALGDAQAIPLALLEYRAADSGALPKDAVHATVQRLFAGGPDAKLAAIKHLGGTAAVNADLAGLGFNGIDLTDGAGMATAGAVGAMLDAIHAGPLLSKASRTALLAAMSTGDSAADAGAGFVSVRGRVFEVVVLVNDPYASAKERRRAYAAIAAACDDAARRFPL